MRIGIPDTVLVVEDERHTAENTEVMLTEIGVRTVMIAANFEDAAVLLDKASFDLAILDFNIGESAGWGIARALCDQGTAIIVTSMSEQVTLPASCANAAILKKPYSLNDLASLVQRANTN